MDVRTMSKIDSVEHRWGLGSRSAPRIEHVLDRKPCDVEVEVNMEVVVQRNSRYVGYISFQIQSC